MSTALLKVADELRDRVPLPDGFREVRSYPALYGYQELTIDGPFDQSIPDGAEVVAVVHALGDGRFEWQWGFEGELVGPRYPLAADPHAHLRAS